MQNQSSRQSDGFSRIDAAHQHSGQDVAATSTETPAASLVQAAAGLSEEMRDEQTQLQGHQLLMELTRRQREIDRRESQFNAFLATLDQDARSQRIKQSQREGELAVREQECATRLAALTRREVEQQNIETMEGDQASDDADLRRMRYELEEKSLRLEAEKNALRFRWQKMQSQREASMQLIRHLMRSVERRRQSLEQRAERQTEKPMLARQPNDLQKLAQELDQQQQALTDGQAELEKQREQLAAQRQQFQQQQEEWTDSLRREQTRFEHRQQRQQAEHDERQKLLNCRSEELAKRQATLDQVQVNVAETHREALELRLATEQLWSQLGEQIAPRELAETIAQLRSNLSEHYRDAEDDLVRRRDELHAMASKLDEHQNGIRDDRSQLQQWFARRSEEIEYQAARLVAREQELESQQAQDALARQKWDEQRLEYENEIRRLQAKLRQQDAAAA